MSLEKPTSKIEIDELRNQIIEGNVDPFVFKGKKIKIEWYYWESPTETHTEEAIIVDVEVRPMINEELVKKGEKQRYHVKFRLDNGRLLEPNYDFVKYEGEGIQGGDGFAYSWVTVID